MQATFGAAARASAVALVAAFSAAPGAADQPLPFEGIWTAAPDWCRYADQIGSHDPAPIEITGTEIHGLENFCKITSRTGREGWNWWALDLSCAAEGEEYEDGTVLMLEDESTLWRWFGGGEPIRFTRCP